MISTATISIGACVRYPYLASPDASESRFSAEVQAFGSGPEGSENPVARPLPDGTFEVYWGWFLIDAAKMAGLTKISLKVVPADHGEMLKLAIGKVFSDNKLNPMVMAQALSNAKEGLKVSDTELAIMTGLKRSSISRLFNIQKKLISDAYEALRHDQIGISIAKKLAAMPRDQQLAEFAYLRQNNFVWSAFKARNLKSPSSPRNPPPPRQRATQERAPVRKKSVEHQRYELSLSELIGSPVSIDEHEDTDGGKVNISCFSLEEAVGAIKRLKDSNVPCTLSFSYTDNQHLTTILPDQS